MSKKINSSQMASIIDTCLEGVEKSKIGGIYFKDKDGEILYTPEGYPILHTLGMQTYLTVLGCYFPKNFTTESNINV